MTVRWFYPNPTHSRPKTGPPVSQVWQGQAPKEGELFTVAPAGAVTPTGALRKQANKGLAGSVTPAGSLVKAVAKLLAGAVIPTGTLVKQDQKVLAGGTTPSGSLQKLVNKVLAGAVTPTGTLGVTRVILRAFAGVITPVGSIVKNISLLKTGSLGPTYLDVADFGSNFSTPDHADFTLTTQIAVRFKIRMTDYTPAGSRHQLGQASGADGNWSWVYSIHPDGKPRFAVWPDGTSASIIGPDAGVALPFQDLEWACLGCTVNLNEGGTQKRWVYEYSVDDGVNWRVLSSVTESGTTSFFNSVVTVGSPGVFGAGANGYQWAKIWSDVARTTLIADPDFRTAKVGDTSLTDSTGKVWTFGTFTAIKTPARGVLSKLVTKAPFTGSVTPTGALQKLVQKVLGGSTTPTGTLTLIKVVLRSLGGAITPVGNLLKRTNKSLGGGSTPTGALVRTAQKSLSGNATPTGTPRKNISKALAGGVTPSGVLNTLRLIVKFLGGTVTPTGTLRRQAQKGLGGSSIPVGTVRRSVTKGLGGAVTPTGALSKFVSKLFSGVLASIGALLTEIPSGIPLQLKLGNLRRRLGLSAMTRRYGTGGFTRRVETDDLGRRYDAGDMDRRYETGDLNRES